MTKPHLIPPRIHTETLSVRISLPLFRSLVEHAKSDNRTLSNFVRLVLEREVTQQP
jgi:hypothetical protein